MSFEAPGRLLVSSDRKSSEFNVSVQLIYNFRSTVFEQVLLSSRHSSLFVYKGSSLRP